MPSIPSSRALHAGEPGTLSSLPIRAYLNLHCMLPLPLQPFDTPDSYENELQSEQPEQAGPRGDAAACHGESNIKSDTRFRVEGECLALCVHLHEPDSGG